MNVIHIQRQRSNSPNGGQESFLVPAVSINTPGGRRLIPNPTGREAQVYATLDEAMHAVQQAGFEYEFEGQTSLTKSAGRPTGGSVIAGPDALHQSIPVLIKRLSDKEPTVISNAAFALGELAAQAAVDPLCTLLGHDDPLVRKNVAEALAKIGEPSLQALQQAYIKNKDKNEKNNIHARLTVMVAYGELSNFHRELLEYVLPQTLDALEDDNWLVRSQAATVMGISAQYYRED